MNARDQYSLGHSDPEIERLQLQGRVLEGITRRMIAECGVGPGMRVLDIGCGVGDVSLLLAKAVGEDGIVLGIDREQPALDVARLRAARAGLGQIEFALMSDEELSGLAPFDAVVGRYVLVHQPDPVAMVRRAAAAVRPGGAVAFQEIALHIVSRAEPRVELFEHIAESILEAARAVLPHYDVAGRLVSCFEQAGLPTPQLSWESAAGGPDSALIDFAAMTYQTYLPHLERLGLERAEVGDAATLAKRLAADARAAHAQLVTPPQACAWAIRPFGSIRETDYRHG